MSKLFLLLFLIPIVHLSVPENSEDWSFVKEEKGVKLYTRSIDGFEYKEVKLNLSVKTDLHKAKDFLFNPDNIVMWMSGCSQSKAISRSSKTQIYYAIFDAPWPITDRDDIGKITLEEMSSENLLMSFQSTPEAKPVNSKYVRIPYSSGLIDIRPGSNGMMNLEYRLLVDRGGKLPSYLKEYLETTSPFKTVELLKDRLEAI